MLGITHIVTVQRESEKPEDVAKSCKKHGLTHRTIILEGANKPLLENKNTQKRIRVEVRKLFKHMVENKEKVLVHCAAGIHRTGTIGYSLIRLSGLSEKESVDALLHIRPDTHKGVGDWRIELAEKNIVNLNWS